VLPVNGSRKCLAASDAGPSHPHHSGQEASVAAVISDHHNLAEILSTIGRMPLVPSRASNRRWQGVSTAATSAHQSSPDEHGVQAAEAREEPREVDGEVERGVEGTNLSPPNPGTGWRKVAHACEDHGGRRGAMGLPAAATEKENSAFGGWSVGPTRKRVVTGARAGVEE
jgi:hypothetical protein